MLLADSILAQAGRQNLSGYLIYDFLIRLFSLEIVVCTVIIDDRGVSWNDVIALLIQPVQIRIRVGYQDIHKPQDMLVIKRRLLKVGIQMVKSSILGARIKDPGIGEETVDLITIVSDLTVCCYLLKELFQFQPLVNRLQIEVANIHQIGFRKIICCIIHFFLIVDR